MLKTGFRVPPSHKASEDKQARNDRVKCGMTLHLITAFAYFVWGKRTGFGPLLPAFAGTCFARCGASRRAGVTILRWNDKGTTPALPLDSNYATPLDRKIKLSVRLINSRQDRFNLFCLFGLSGFGLAAFEYTAAATCTGNLLNCEQSTCDS